MPFAISLKVEQCSHNICEHCSYAQITYNANEYPIYRLPYSYEKMSSDKWLQGKMKSLADSASFWVAYLCCFLIADVAEIGLNMQIYSDFQRHLSGLVYADITESTLLGLLAFCSLDCSLVIADILCAIWMLKRFTQGAFLFDSVYLFGLLFTKLPILAMQTSIYAGEDFPISKSMVAKSGLCVGLFIPRLLFLLVLLSVLGASVSTPKPVRDSPPSVFTKHFPPTESSELVQGQQSSSVEGNERLGDKSLRDLNKKWGFSLWISIRGLTLIFFCLLLALNIICLVVFGEHLNNAQVERWSSQFASLSTPLTDRYLKNIDLLIPLEEWEPAEESTKKWIRLTNIESIMLRNSNNTKMLIELSEMKFNEDSNLLAFSAILKQENETRTLSTLCWKWKIRYYVEELCPQGYHPLEGREFDVNPFNITRSIFLKFFYNRPSGEKPLGSISYSALEIHRNVKMEPEHSVLDIRYAFNLRRVNATQIDDVAPFYEKNIFKNVSRYDGYKFDQQLVSIDKVWLTGLFQTPTNASNRPDRVKFIDSEH